MNDGHNQATSAPYSADNLKPHDEQLILPIEFGTETLLTSGDLFTGDQPTVNSVNARMGMLEAVQLNESPSGIQGATVLLPEWSSYPRSPFGGPNPEDPTAIVMYAHVIKREANTDTPDEVAACLVLAGEDFVGDVSGEQCTAFGSVGDPMSDSEESSALAAGFGNGAGTDPSALQLTSHWGSNLYFRLFLTGDDTKEADAFVWVSRDGLSWTPLLSTQILAGGDAMRRVGVGVIGGPGIAWLDWVRIYAYPLESESFGFLQPLMPLTGGRRFG